MVYLTEELWFPPAHLASSEGLLAFGGDLSPERLLLAYRSGIFPWYNESEPILWWCPDPRMVLFPEELKVSKSLRRILQKEEFSITIDKAFSEVINQCATVKRENQRGTWITKAMLEAYEQLHALGHAHSVEVWKDEKLVGGLYGVDLPDIKVFCGESMFSAVSNASKVALYHWVEKLKRENYKIIDCQVYNPHLESLGAKEIPRTLFLEYLAP